MKCPLLKETTYHHTTYASETVIDYTEESYKGCIGSECAAYIPATSEVLGGRKVKETAEDCRMMRK